MQDISSNGYHRPVKGLMRLTWPQVEKIDAMISSLCGLTEETHKEAHLILVIRNGKVRFATYTNLSEELLPTRS
jgi:hypothetical protein